MKKLKDKTISFREVKHTADLARLPLKKHEIKKFESQLSNIFDYVGQIDEMKTEKTLKTSQVSEAKNIFREDKIDATRIFSQEEALGNAKRKMNGFFVVKAILE